MRLVKTISREVFKLIPNTFGYVTTNTLFNTACDELGVNLHLGFVTLARPLLGEKFAKLVALIKGQVLAQLMGEDCNLLLEDKKAVSFLSYLLDKRVVILNVLRVLLGFHILVINFS